MRVLLLGGTGAMGSYLADILSERGDEVVVTSRSMRLSSDSHLSYVQGNAGDDHFIEDFLGKSDLWDCIVDFMVYIPEDFKRRVTLLLNSTSQYLFLSSSRVYAESSEPLTENSPRLLDISRDSRFLRMREYSLSKAREEDILTGTGRENWTIIRPYITYGDYRLQLGTLEKETWLRRAIEGKRVPLAGAVLDKETTLTWGRDVSLAIASLIGNLDALGEVFHITQPKPIKWREVIDIYDSVLAASGYKILLKEMTIPEFITCQNARYQVLYDRMYDRVFNTSKISRHYDVAMSKSPEQGLRESLEHFLKSPRFGRCDWYAEGRMDRLCGDHQKVRSIPDFKSKVIYLMARYLPYKVLNTVWHFTTQMKRIIRY